MRKIIILVILLWASPLFAADYYVATTGSDAADGSIGTPFLTLCKALQTAVAGDTINIRGGTHTAGWPLKIQTGGCTGVNSGVSFANAITIQPYMDEIVVLGPFNAQIAVSYLIFQAANGSLTFDSRVGGAASNSGIRLATTAVHHIRFDGVEVMETTGSGGISVNLLSHDNEFLNMDVHDNGETTNIDHGMYLSCAQNTLIKGGSYYNNAASGIQQWYTTAPGTPCGGGTIVDGVRIYNNGFVGATCAPGTYFGNGTDSVFKNSLVYNNCSIGIDTQWGAVDGMDIFNNSVWNNGSIGINLNSQHASVDKVARNNIVFGNGSGINNPLGYTTSNNLTADPGYTDAPNGDFTISPGSPAVNFGFDLTGLVDTDFLNNPRPSDTLYDAGAYEVQFGTDCFPLCAYNPVTGDNGGDGTPGDPWETFGFAVSQAPCGTTIQAQPGESVESATVEITTSCPVGNEITVTAVTTASVSFGTSVTRGVYLVDASGWHFSGIDFDATNTTEHGFLADIDSENFRLTDLDVTDAGGIGVEANSDGIILQCVNIIDSAQENLHLVGSGGSIVIGCGSAAEIATISGSGTDNILVEDGVALGSITIGHENSAQNTTTPTILSNFVSTGDPIICALELVDNNAQTTTVTSVVFNASGGNETFVDYNGSTLVYQNGVAHKLVWLESPSAETASITYTLSAAFFDNAIWCGSIENYASVRTISIGQGTAITGDTQTPISAEGDLVMQFVTCQSMSGTMAVTEIGQVEITQENGVDAAVLQVSSRPAEESPATTTPVGFAIADDTSNCKYSSLSLVPGTIPDLSENIIINGYRITGATGAGINLQGESATIVNNIIDINGTDGIISTSITPKFLNNSIHNNTGDGIEIASGTTCIIRNNISFMNGGTAIDDGCDSTTNETNLTTDPDWVDPDNGDFNLDTGSAAIDTGTVDTDSSPDIFGFIRPIDGDADLSADYDIGAVEAPTPVTTPVLTSLNISEGYRGLTYNIVLTGTDFDVATCDVSLFEATGITVQNVSCDSSTSITAEFVIDVDSLIEIKNVFVENAGGQSAPQPFLVIGANLWYYQRLN